MAVETRTVEYKHRDTVLEGIVAVDSASSQPRPVVLVSHAWGGRDEFAIQKARDLARLGYVGFALDLYGQGKLGTSKEENSALMAPLLEDRLLLQARMESAIQAAASQPESDAKKVAWLLFWWPVCARFGQNRSRCGRCCQFPRIVYATRQYCRSQDQIPCACVAWIR